MNLQKLRFISAKYEKTSAEISEKCSRTWTIQLRCSVADKALETVR